MPSAPLRLCVEPGCDSDHEIPEVPVFAEEWDAAIRRIELTISGQAALSLFAKRCLWNAAEHLSKRLARTFRDSPRFESEQVALSILKGAANDLRTASQELQQAAQRFKDLGKGTWANQSYLASKRAQQAAEGLVGSA